MRRTFRDEGETKRDDTRSYAWDSVGLTQQVDQQAIRKALILLILLVGVVLVYWHRQTLFGRIDMPARIAAAIAVALIGWALARDIGRAAAPTFFRRMDPATAGTVGFLIRLATVATTLLGALAILAVPRPTLALGGSITAILIGLAASRRSETCSPGWSC
jgi:small conductance mechanosensitive channel